MLSYESAKVDATGLRFPSVDLDDPELVVAEIGPALAKVNFLAK
jgi:hypothetical protein